MTSSSLSALYQEVIFDHYRHPRHYYALPGVQPVKGHNPLCGDALEVYLRLSADGQRIDEISFTGTGCAISTASASLLSEAVSGLELAAARRLCADFLAGLSDVQEPDPVAFGKLAVLLGVRDHPSRIKCASLAWHALARALDAPPVVTEVALVAALKTVIDPDIQHNIYDLGLIYRLEIGADGKIEIDMTLTSPGCPVAGSFPDEVAERVRAVPGVRSVQVNLVWEPPWSPDAMSEAMRVQLGLY